MDVVDLRDKLSMLSRSVGCVAGLLANQRHVAVTGGELAALLAMLESEINAIEDAIGSVRFVAV